MTISCDFNRDNDLAEAIGTIDELNSYLGVVKACMPDDAYISKIQHSLFVASSELVLSDDSEKAEFKVGRDDIDFLWDGVYDLSLQLPQLDWYTSPGKNHLDGHLHMARTVCRRAERRLDRLSKTTPVRQEVMDYFKQLGTFLYWYARYSSEV